jgi:hypothetical protein
MRHPTKQACLALEQANSVYDLPSTKQAIRGMHVVCGYPVKSTWLKAEKTGNFVGWPILTEKNVTKHYPDTAETQKGHMNQSRKNVWSKKPKPEPLEVFTSAQMWGKKIQDVFSKVYKSGKLFSPATKPASSHTVLSPVTKI